MPVASRQRFPKERLVRVRPSQLIKGPNDIEIFSTSGDFLDMK